MAVNTYNMHRRARSGFYELSPDEQRQVEDKLQALTNLPPWQWPGAKAISLPDTPPDYLVPVNDSLRLIVRAEEGKPLELLDIIRQETIDLFARAAVQAAE
jgi:hypothetical protein